MLLIIAALALKEEGKILLRSEKCKFILKYTLVDDVSLMKTTRIVNVFFSRVEEFINL